MNLKKYFQKDIGQSKGNHYKHISLALIVIVSVMAFASIVLAASVSKTFTTEADISGGVGRETTNVVGVNGTAPFGGIKIAPCYSPVSPWLLVGTSPTTMVRNLSVTANATTYIAKDIYCDTVRCILWTPAPAAPPSGTICIATNPNVYPQTVLGYGLLWRMTDSGSKAWAASYAPYYNTLLSGYNTKDIGGTHTANKAGSGNTTITNYKWLERFYTSPVGSYPAMDTCKALGLGWRLPNILELDSIRDSTPTGGGVYSRLPGIVASDDYVSASELGALYSLGMYFSSGTVAGGNYGKYFGHNVRCVRGY